MGLILYFSKFMPDVVLVAMPTQELTRKGVVFHWGKKLQTAFEDLKPLITQAETLAHFKVGCRTRIIADVSPGHFSPSSREARGELSRKHQEA